MAWTRARVIALIAFYRAGGGLAGLSRGYSDRHRRYLWKDVKYAWANCSAGRPIFFRGLPGSVLLFTGVIFLCTAIPVAIILSLAATIHDPLPCPGASDFGGASNNGRTFVGEFSLLAAVCLHFEFEGLDALRESKLLARSKRRPRKSTRPLWRGALLVSLWILIVAWIERRRGNSFDPAEIAEPFDFVSGRNNEMWQDLNTPKVADAMLIGSMAISSLVRALLAAILALRLSALFGYPR